MEWNDTYQWDQDPEALKPYAFKWAKQIQPGDTIQSFDVTCANTGCEITRKELDVANHTVSFWIKVSRPGVTFEIVQRCETALGVKLKLTTFLNCEVR